MSAVPNSFPAGVRNNNPLNIIPPPSVTFHGQAGHDEGGRAIFISPMYGVRAAMLILNNYIMIDGVKTVANMIRRWAPPESNPTDTYISYVARRMGVAPSHQPKPYKGFVAMTAAMAEFENGWNPYSIRLYLEVAQWLSENG